MPLAPSIDAELIARACHAASRELQLGLREPVPSEPWDQTPRWIQDITINAVEMIRRGATAAEVHEEWCERYRKKEWQYGPDKDFTKKTHPCLVAYYELSASQRRKSQLFHAMVLTLSIVT